MRPSSIVKSCVIVVASGVVCICGMNFSDTEDTERIKELNKFVTQNYQRTLVNSKVTALSNAQGNTTADPGIPGVADPVSNDEWINWLDKCHKAFGGQGLIYDYGGEEYITHFDGSSIKVRQDCSGYIGYALYCAGYYPASPLHLTSGSDYSVAGFTNMGSLPMEQLKPGDLVAWSGHIQAFAGTDDRGYIWYNWGDHSTAQDLYAGVSDPSTVVSTTTSRRTSANGIVWRRN